MAASPSAPEPEPAPAPAPAPAQEPATVQEPAATLGADGSGGGLSSEDDHLGNIVRGISSGAALVKIGFNRVLSALTPKADPDTPEVPTVPAATTRTSPTICKYIFDLYEDCSGSYYDCKKYSPLLKHCALLESTENSRVTDETTAPEDNSSIPIPFDLVLMAFKGCVSRDYSSKDSKCQKKYVEMLETSFNAD